MTKPMVRIHNIATNEIIDREMTDAEFAQYELYRQAELIKEAELTAKATARQAVLDRLGITAEEAQLILGGSN
jgi:hypothetical protein